LEIVVRRFKSAECHDARNQCDLDAADLREIKFGLRKCPSALKGENIRLAPAILRANRSICWVRSALAVTPAARPCRKEFRLDRLLPAAERGPVLRRALRRLAALCRSLAMFRRPLTAISSRH
jgi:hypothetical protein